MKRSLGDSTTCSAPASPSLSSCLFLLMGTLFLDLSLNAADPQLASLLFCLPRKAHRLLYTFTIRMGVAPEFLSLAQIPAGAPDSCTPKCLTDLSAEMGHKHLKLNTPQAHPYPVVIISVAIYPKTQIRNKKPDSSIHPLCL